MGAGSAGREEKEGWPDRTVCLKNEKRDAGGVFHTKIWEKRGRSLVEPGPRCGGQSAGGYSVFPGGEEGFFRKRENSSGTGS